MQRVIGMDIHRTFAEVVFWEAGRLRPAGRIDMTRSGLDGFGRNLSKQDEVVVEATGNAMAVVRLLSPYVARVIVANPLQVRAIAHAHVKTDKIDAGVQASLRAAGFLPEVWLPDADTELRRRLVARRNQVVRHRTRIKNEVHSILQAHLIPPCPHADLFGRLRRTWLGRQELPIDERAAIERHLRELDRLGEDLELLDREIAERVIEDPSVKRLLTITGVNINVAAGLVAAIGDIRRFPSPQKLVSYVGLNPRVRQSGLGLAQHGRISKRGRSHARAMLVEAAWAASKAPGPLRSFFLRIRARRGHQVAAVAVDRGDVFLRQLTIRIPPFGQGVERPHHDRADLLNDARMPNGEGRGQPPGYGHQRHRRDENRKPAPGAVVDTGEHHVQIDPRAGDEHQGHVDQDEE
jgi:transposase